MTLYHVIYTETSYDGNGEPHTNAHDRHVDAETFAELLTSHKLCCYRRETVVIEGCELSSEEIRYDHFYDKCLRAGKTPNRKPVPWTRAR